MISPRPLIVIFALVALVSLPCAYAQWQDYAGSYFVFDAVAIGPPPRLERMDSVTINVSITDKSFDGYYGYGGQHIYTIKINSVSDLDCGASIEQPSVIMITGQTSTVSIRVTSSAKFNATKPLIVNISISLYVPYAAYMVSKDILLGIIPMPYGLPAMEIIGDVTKKTAPDNIVKCSIIVTNVADAEDDVIFSLKGENIAFSISPQRLHLGPKETREVSIYIVAPRDKYFFYMEQYMVEITAKSVNSPNLEDKKAVFIEVTGFSEKAYPYIAAVAIALLLAVALAAGVIEKSRKETAAACGTRPKKRAFTAEEKQRLEKLKAEKPELYGAFVRKQDEEYRQALARYNACVGMHRKKKALLAKRAAQERAVVREKRAEEMAVKRKEREIAGKKRELERKAAAIKREEEKKARKVQAAENKKQAELNKKNAAELKKRLEKKKKEVGKLALRKQKDAEKQKAKLLKEIEKRKRAAEKLGAGEGEAPKPPIQS